MRPSKLPPTAPGRPGGLLYRAVRGPTLFAIVIVASGCSSVLVRGGPSYDLGTLGVSGVETGFGGQAEAIGYRQRGGTGYGLGLTLELAGYSTEGDGDPVAFTSLEGRHRIMLGEGEDAGVYSELGTGVGLAWAPGVQRVTIPLQGEAGVQERWAGTFFSLGIRERFLPMIGEGSPAFDVLNSVQVVAGVGLSFR